MLIFTSLLSVVSIFCAIFFFLKKQLQNKDFQVIKNDKQKLEQENNSLNNNIDELQNEKQQLEIKYSKLQGEFETLKANHQKQEEFFKEQQAKQEKWIKEQQENQKNIFQNISNTALEKQTEIGKQKIDEILKPLQEAIDKNSKINNETSGVIKGKIDEMLKQTIEIGGKADRLANAFEGDKKGQGNFGELKFEELLHWYGFNEGENYYKQYLVKTE